MEGSTQPQADHLYKKQQVSEQHNSIPHYNSSSFILVLAITIVFFSLGVGEVQATCRLLPWRYKYHWPLFYIYIDIYNQIPLCKLNETVV